MARATEAAEEAAAERSRFMAASEEAAQARATARDAREEADRRTMDGPHDPRGLDRRHGMQRAAPMRVISAARRK